MRSAEDLQQGYSEQRLALRASSKAYDEGHLWEAKRLATTAYILLHDGGGRIVSVLTQLGVRDTLPFVSTARDIKNSAPAIALVTMEFGDEGVIYAPYLNRPSGIPWQHELLFDAWWNEIIFENRRTGANLARKDLVFALRSQDGGSHYDRQLRGEAYPQFSTHGDASMTTGGDGLQEGPIPYAHLASMRQIAWEIEATLEALTI